MNFTFGIITGGNQEENIFKIIDSIREQKIENYEIIIVGNCNIKCDDVKNIKFNEKHKQNWITKKKNLITDVSKYENIVFLHDYIKLDKDWYSGWLKFGEKYEACMNKIIDIKGNRFTDWTLWIWDGSFFVPRIDKNRECHLPYDCDFLSKIMYFSGSYFVAKKYIMEEFPFNENLCWGQGEDLEWSVRFRNKYNFKMNINSSVHLLKEKQAHFNEIKKETLEELKIKFDTYVANIS